MQLNLLFIAAALSAASGAMSATIVAFQGADCTGRQIASGTVNSNVCGTLGGNSARSIRYSGVPTSIQFFISGGQHDSCTHGSQIQLRAGSGCANAPDGVNWNSVFVR